MKTKRVILLILLILNCTVIFLFSNQDAEKSTAVSGEVTTKIVDVYIGVKNKDITASEKKNIIKNTHTLIRKMAHFTIYMMLGIITYLFISTFNFDHPIIITLVFTILYAASDEFHQYFINGRSAQILDVLIDSTGSLTGILLVNLPKTLKNHRINTKKRNFT